MGHVRFLFMKSINIQCESSKKILKTFEFRPDFLFCVRESSLIDRKQQFDKMMEVRIYFGYRCITNLLIENFELGIRPINGFLEACY